MRRTLFAAALVAGIVVSLAGPARAHVELEPTQAEAGSTVTLTFRFQHGLEGTATTRLEVKVPDGVAVVDVPEVPGWSGRVSQGGAVVAWTGGSVPDGTEGTFPLVVRLPDEPGFVLFPTIQTTEAGELAWISEDGGEGEDARPAPRLDIVAGGAQDPSAAATTSTTAPSGAPRDLPRTALEADRRDGGGSLAPWLIGSGVLAVVAIVVGGTLLGRRAG